VHSLTRQRLEPEKAAGRAVDEATGLGGPRL
jgi:hypothetical protein